jgi:hypothetical protein
MPAFYKVVNSTAVKASTGRSFIYLGLIDGEPFTIGHTPNLNTKIHKNLMIEAFANKYKKPASIWILGSITESFAAPAIKELTHILKSAGCTKINNLESKVESPDLMVVNAAIQTWSRKYKIKTSVREQKRSPFTAEDILSYVKTLQMPSVGARKVLMFLIENYYQNYSVSISPMPLFYNGNTDQYRKDLNEIKHMFFTREGINKYSSNNFNMAKPFIEGLTVHLTNKETNRLEIDA